MLSESWWKWIGTSALASDRQLANLEALAARRRRFPFSAPPLPSSTATAMAAASQRLAQLQSRPSRATPRLLNDTCRSP